MENPGGGSNAVNKVQERHFKMECHRDAMKKMDDLQSQIKNDKIRQCIQDEYRGEDSELRVGIAASGTLCYL